MDNIYHYFSQYGEDYLIWKFFNYKQYGFFVDIGAFDGIHLSNTYSFERIGWKGICVEPHPYYFELCKKNRPNTVCINKACGKKEQADAALYIDNTGLFSSLKEIGDGENISEHYGVLDSVDMKLDSTKVEIAILNTILEENLNDNSIDFISIDVEGVELDVLKGFDIERYKPVLIVVETNSNESEKEITAYMQKYGYLFARKTNANSFYVANEENVNKLKGIKLNCIIEKQIHPLGRRYTVPFYIDGMVIFEGKGGDIFKKLYQLSQVQDDLTKSKEKVQQLIDNNKELLHTIELKNGRIQKTTDKLESAGKEIQEKEQEIEKVRNEAAYLRKELAEYEGSFITKIIKIRRRVSSEWKSIVHKLYR